MNTLVSSNDGTFILLMSSGLTDDRRLPLSIFGAVTMKKKKTEKIPG